MRVIKVRMNDTKVVVLKNLKKGEYFTIKPIEEPKESQVWVMEGYDRSTKKYSAHKFSDINHSKEFKGIQKVYIDFTF